jgi:hypothetical protein
MHFKTFCSGGRLFTAVVYNKTMMNGSGEEAVMTHFTVSE